MKLSIVATLYQSELNIDEFCSRMSQAANIMVDDDYEIILVNDGSPDKSLDRAIELSRHNPHITVVDLSRNFGHHKAMMTGLSYAQGEYIYLIDSDLEEEPEWLHSFYDTMQEQKADVVFGIQQQRKGGFFERYSGKIFYALTRLLIDKQLPTNITVARLMSRRYLDALLRHKEREVYIAGLWHITGFNQVAHPVKKHHTSETTYTLRRKVSLFVNSITSFSNVPLVSIFYVGVFILLFAGFYSGFLIINKLFFHTYLNGWTSVIASIWLLGGLIILFLGIIGIYLSKIFVEIKNRPYTIVRDIYNSRNSNE